MNPTASVQKQDITGFSYQLASIEQRLIEIIQLLHQISEQLAPNIDKRIDKVNTL